jgi:hypothetical protein
VTLPLPLRNRLAELILESLHDPAARAGLETLTAVCADPRALPAGVSAPVTFPEDLFERGPAGLAVKSGYRAHAPELCERAQRGWDVVRRRPLDPPDATLASVLAAAAALFDAGLYFEVHELIEPHWLRADGAEREALQGLIQVAVGFQHLANGNVRGAVALLGDGGAKLRRRATAGAEVSSFATAVERCRVEVVALGADAARFDWTTVPRFPRMER